MASGRITANGNLTGEGASPEGWVNVTGNSCKISVQNNFGGGSVAIQEEIKSKAFPLLDLGVAVVLTTADASEYNLFSGDRVRLVLSGATNPDLFWSITFGKQ